MDSRNCDRQGLLAAIVGRAKLAHHLSWIFDGGGGFFALRLIPR